MSTVIAPTSPRVTVTPDEVWIALANDSAFTGEMPAAAMPVMEKYVRMLPVLLEDLLAHPLDVATLCQAKLRFLRACIQEGYVTEFINALPTGSMLGPMADTMEQMMSGLVEQLAGMMEDLPSFLEANGMSEEQVMLGEQVGLSSDNAELYKSNLLTLAELLATQPLVIVKNN